MFSCYLDSRGQCKTVGVPVVVYFGQQFNIKDWSHLHRSPTSRDPRSDVHNMALTGCFFFSLRSDGAELRKEHRLLPQRSVQSEWVFDKVCVMHRYFVYACMAALWYSPIQWICVGWHRQSYSYVVVVVGEHWFLYSGRGTGKWSYYEHCVYCVWRLFNVNSARLISVSGLLPQYTYEGDIRAKRSLLFVHTCSWYINDYAYIESSVSTTFGQSYSYTRSSEKCILPYYYYREHW